jgi:hypothetical protein
MLSLIPKRYTIYCFWTDDTPMTDNRKKCLQNLRDVSKCHVKLITYQMLPQYVLPNYPLHPAYPYLSPVHKADYLRCYFMHFYGGGYADIKLQMGSWLKAFRDMDLNPTACVNGYQAGGPDNVSDPELKEKWKELIGVGQFIIRPQTDFTREWYTALHMILDTHLEQLKQHPAKHPYDCATSGTGYPIGYTELLGIPFNQIQHKYRHRTIFTLPKHYLSHYR